jgi:PII-like signaling protein
MISVVDSPERIAVAIEEIVPMLQDGLIVTSDVEMIRLSKAMEDAEGDHGAA